MRLHSISGRVSDVDRALVDLVAAFPAARPEPAARQLAERLSPSGSEELCRFLVDRRLTHVYAAVCAPVLQEFGPVPFRRAQRFIDEMTALHLSELAGVSDDFAVAGIDYRVPKGIVFPLTVYPQLPVAFSGDVDVLVRSADLAPARDILTARGYQQGLVVRGNAPMRLPRQQVERLEAAVWMHGQTAAYTKLVRTPHLDQDADFARRMFPFHVVVAGGRVHLRPTFDLHYSLNGLTEDTGRGDRPDEELWWANAQLIRGTSGSFPALSDLTLSWFIPYHLYMDLALYRDRNWKLIADLIAFARTGRLDFPELAAVAGKFAAIRPAVYYVYRALQVGFHVPVPREFLDTVSEPSDAYGADLGDVLPAMMLGQRCEFHVASEGEGNR